MRPKHDFKYFLVKATYFIMGLYKLCFVLAKGHTYRCVSPFFSIQSYYMGKRIFYETHTGSGLGFMAYEQKAVPRSIIEIGIFKWHKIN